MTEAADLRSYSSRYAVCLVISVLGLLAVPYVGTRWGDFNEMCALIIGLAPLFYILAFSIANLNQRLAALESGNSRTQSAPASIASMSSSDRPK